MTRFTVAWWKDASGQDRFDRAGSGSSRTSEVLNRQCTVREMPQLLTVRAAKGSCQK